MIKDQEMFELGFKKIKTYKKKQIGISSYCWHKNGLFLTIEKNYGSDNFSYFLPTLRIHNRIIYFYKVKNLKKLLKILKIN
jgi:hypothetical protein